MKEFIIIAGTQNSGKTTTAWCVYQRLLPYSNKNHFWINDDKEEKENHGEIVFKDAPSNNYPEDFYVELNVYGKKVVIISAGDYAETLESGIKYAYSKADFIVISLRAYNRSGSSRRMLSEKYPNDYTKQFWVEVPDVSLTHPLDIINSKRPVADRIVNYILVQTNYNQLV